MDKNYITIIDNTGRNVLGLNVRETETEVDDTEKDDGEEDTSKTTSAPMKSLLGAVKEFFTLRRGPSPFKNYPPHMF
jgi:hypothetical protein